MTTFVRSGFWRTSRNGNLHWVEGHMVRRTDWYRSAATTPAYVPPWTRSYTAAFVNPNAKCPVCDRPVFYYQNQFGSRVYFDELGPPWPKHPCTDSRLHVAAPPTIRDEYERKMIRASIGSNSDDRLRHFNERYGSSPWPAYRVAKRLTGHRGTLLILQSLGATKHLLYLSAHRLSRSVAVGDLAFYSRSRLSFLADLIEPRTADVTPLEDAEEFIAALLESSPSKEDS